MKRQLRELARLIMLPTAISADIVLRIRPEAYGASFDQLGTDIRRAMVQLKQWYQTLDSIPPEIEVPPLQVGDTE